MPETDALPIALLAAEVPPRSTRSLYPEPFAARMDKREKRVLGDRFGLANFGVNLTRIAPGGESALRHAHATQDEFIYVLEGHPTLLTDAGVLRLSPGMCAGFRAGSGNAHCLRNDGNTDVVFLEVGDRSAGDAVTYPDDDLRADYVDGAWRFAHRDGSPYS